MSDIDIKNKRISIRNIINFRKELQPGTKTATGIRSIGYEDRGHLICTKSGQPLSDYNLRDVWVRLVRMHGFRQIRFHDLRHTCATLLLSLDVHPKVVQSLLGHTSFRMTMDLYSHVMPSMKSEAASAIETLLT